MTETKKQFQGKWRIVKMSNWDEDYFNIHGGDRSLFWAKKVKSGGGKKR